MKTKHYVKENKHLDSPAFHEESVESTIQKCRTIVIVTEQDARYQRKRGAKSKKEIDDEERTECNFLRVNEEGGGGQQA